MVPLTPFQATLSPADLALLAFLEGRVLPASLGSGTRSGSADPLGDVRAQVSRSASSLVDSGTLSVVDGEAYVAPATRRLVQLLCDAEWSAEGSSLYVDGGAIDFRLSGVGDEGVLVTCYEPAVLTLSYRPEARLAVAEVFRAMAATDRPVEDGPSIADAEPLGHTEVSQRPEWSARRAHSIAVECDDAVSDGRRVTWIVMGAATFLVEPRREGPGYVPSGHKELDAQLTKLAATLVGA